MNTFSRKWDDATVWEILTKLQSGRSFTSLRKEYKVQVERIKHWATKAGIVIETTITSQMYGWSKYGGADEGLVKEELTIWHCQGCGDQQVKEMAQYMIPLSPALGEYARVCALCKNIALDHQVVYFCDLLPIIREKSIYISYDEDEVEFLF